MAVELSSTTTTLTALVHFILIVEFIFCFFTFLLVSLSGKNSSYVSDAMLCWADWPSCPAKSLLFAPLHNRSWSRSRSQSLALASWCVTFGPSQQCECTSVYVCVHVARVCGNCKPSMTRYSRSLCPTVVNRFPHYTIRFLAVLAQLATPLSPPPLLFISILLIFLVSFPAFCRRKRFTLNSAMVRRDRQRYEWFSFVCSSLAFLMSYRCMFCIMRWMIPAHK